MYSGPLVFSQVIDYRPMKTFRRCVDRYQGNFAIKFHTLLDLRGNIPTFIHISDGKRHEVNILDDLIAESGSFYVMDRCYLDLFHLYWPHQGIRFLYHPSQEEPDVSARLLKSSGSQHRFNLRPDGGSDWTDLCPLIPG